MGMEGPIFKNSQKSTFYFRQAPQKHLKNFSLKPEQFPAKGQELIIEFSDLRSIKKAKISLLDRSFDPPEKFSTRFPVARKIELKLQEMLLEISDLKLPN